MSDSYKVTVLNQKVFHDGRSMIVLHPKRANPEVEERFIAGLVEDGFIEKPKGWKPPVVEPIAVADGSQSVVPVESTDTDQAPA